MQEMAISQFKAHALKIIDQVAQTHETLVITKRGKPIVQITPYLDERALSQPGNLEDSLVFEEGIVAPIGEGIWEASS